VNHCDLGQNPRTSCRQFNINPSTIASALLPSNQANSLKRIDEAYRGMMPDLEPFAEIGNGNAARAPAYLEREECLIFLWS